MLIQILILVTTLSAILTRKLKDNGSTAKNTKIQKIHGKKIISYKPIRNY
ncbi:MAG: hypothetical protein ACLTEH_02490 [Clostridia bacterium]